MNKPAAPISGWNHPFLAFIYPGSSELSIVSGQKNAGVSLHVHLPRLIEGLISLGSIRLAFP